MSDRRAKTHTLALAFVVWPFAAALLLAMAAVLCAVFWLAIPFLNRISDVIEPASLSPRQFYE